MKTYVRIGYHDVIDDSVGSFTISTDSIEYYVKDFRKNNRIDHCWVRDGKGEVIMEENFTPSPINIQTVWRVMSNESIGGWFVWEVLEVIGDMSNHDKKFFEECTDGSYILIQCMHFFTKEKAREYLLQDDSPYQRIIIVP